MEMAGYPAISFSKLNDDGCGKYFIKSKKHFPQLSI